MASDENVAQLPAASRTFLKSRTNHTLLASSKTTGDVARRARYVGYGSVRNSSVQRGATPSGEGLSPALIYRRPTFQVPRWRWGPAVVAPRSPACGSAMSTWPPGALGATADRRGGWQAFPQPDPAARLGRLPPIKPLVTQHPLPLAGHTPLWPVYRCLPGPIPNAHPADSPTSGPAGSGPTR